MHRLWEDGNAERCAPSIAGRSIPRITPCGMLARLVSTERGKGCPGFLRGMGIAPQAARWVIKLE